MQFGGVVAVNDLSMEINRGEIVALIGPNGAGKTTAFNCVTGVYEPTNGEILFEGKPIARNHPTGRMRKLYAGTMARRLSWAHHPQHAGSDYPPGHCAYLSEHSPFRLHDGI